MRNYLEQEISKVKDLIIHNYKTQSGVNDLNFLNGKLKALLDALDFLTKKI